MSKEVEYQIRLVDHPTNRQAMKGMEDAISASLGRMEKDLARIGVAAGSAARASSGRTAGGINAGDYERQLDRLKGLGDKAMREMASNGKRMGQAIGESIAVGGAKGVDELQRQIDKVMGKVRATNGDKRGRGIADSILGSLGELDGLTNHIEKATKEADRFGDRFERSFKKAQEDVGKAATGIFEMARGVTMLSMSGQDAEKVLGVLLKVQGTWDAVSGSFRAVTGVREAWKSLGSVIDTYRARQQAAASVTRLQAEASQRLVVLQAQLARAMQGTNAMTAQQAQQMAQLRAQIDQAAAAKARFAAMPNGGGIGGPMIGGRGMMLGGGAMMVGGLAGGLAGGALEQRLTGGDTGYGSLIGGLGGSLGAGYLGSKLGGVSLAGIGGSGALALGGAGLAAAGGVAFGGTSAVSSFSAMGKYGFGGGADVGSFADTVASAEVRLAAWAGQIDAVRGTFRLFEKTGDRTAGSIADLADSNEALARAQRFRAKTVAQAEMDEHHSQLGLIKLQGQRQIADMRGDAEDQSMQRRVALGLMRPTDAVNVSRRRVEQELAGETQFMRSYERGDSKDHQRYTDSLQRSAELHQRMERLQVQMTEAVRAEADLRSRMNQESINAAQTRLGIVQQEKALFQTNEERLETAAVRFARLDPEKQRAVIGAQQKAQSGGRLSLDQRSLLDSLGLGNESAMVRQQDIGDARRAGFFSMFGSAERDQMQGSLSRRDRMMQLQQEARSLGTDMPPSVREDRLRSIREQQEALAEENRLAASKGRPGGSRADREFGSLEDSVRSEIAVRNQIEVQAKIDIEKTVRDISSRLDAQIGKQMEVVAKRVQEEQDRKTFNLIQQFSEKQKADGLAARQ